MEWLAPLQHHIVGDIHDVVDGPHAGFADPVLDPLGRGPDLHVLDDGGNISGAQARVLDLNAGQIRRGRAFGLPVRVGVAQRHAGQSSYLPSYADHVEIRISTTQQNDPSYFDVVVDEIDFASGASTEWIEYTYNLTDFVAAGTNIYIGFRENVADNQNDGSAISIDNVYVGAMPVENANNNYEKVFTNVTTISQATSIEKDFDYVHVPNTHFVESTRDLLGFNVYRDDVMINEGTVIETTYVDENLSASTYVYYVKAVYDEGESGPSNEVIVVITGIDELERTVSIYPNPANNVVNINSDTQLKTVRIINYTGQVVYSQNVSGNTLSINTSNLATGIYVLQFETESGWSGQKLVIE